MRILFRATPMLRAAVGVLAAALAALVLPGWPARAADSIPDGSAPTAPLPAVAGRGAEPLAPPSEGTRERASPVPAPSRPSLLLLLSPRSGLAAPTETYTLNRATDGSGDLLYRAAGFEARIHRDGSVTFADRHFSSMFFPWLPQGTRAHGPTVESMLRGAWASRTSGAGGAAQRPVGPAPLLIPTTTPYRPGANDGCLYPAPCFVDSPVILLSAAGTFDLTDEVMRHKGEDPYRYDKARFMSETAELRVRLAARAHADDLRQAEGLLRSRLETIAADLQLSRVERRATIEALAREMDDATPDGRSARAVIDAFLSARFGEKPAER